MIKVMLGLAMAFGGLSLQPVMASVPVFSSSVMAQNTVSNLTLDNIVTQLYEGESYHTSINDDAIKTMPYMSLGSIGDDYNEQTIAVMHPVVTYTNTSGEMRHLVVIEKVKMTSKDHKLVSCHNCAAKADLFVFKRLRNGNYALVSRSTDDMELPGSWGRVMLDSEMLQDNIEPLGRDIVGSVFESGYMSTGTYQGVWNALHFNEDDYIRSYSFGDAGGDNSGYYEVGSPKLYTYTSTYEVQQDGSSVYPIKITYSGTKPNCDKEGRVEPANYSEILRFDTVAGNYE